MVCISTSKISSKGQILIPKKMRSDFSEGQEIVIIQNNNELILKRLKDVEDEIKDDLEFNKRTNQARQKIEDGLFKEMGFDKFVKHLKTL